ncbi:MAG: hypothetical protein H0T82_11495, partial [Sphingomonas sp.]|nr:hypothetical protein [Sphingomonas sp.]
LSRRAGLALDRLVARYPMLQRARTLARWPPALNWLLPLAALVIGLATNAIEGDRLNILAFPLLGMLVWNVAVYAWLLVDRGRRAVGGRSRASQGRGLVSWILRPPSAHLAGHPTLERAVTRFGSDWVAAATPLTEARARRTLHLSAATFAVGIIAGMFARARYTAEYTAGWAGTWTGAEAEIAALLKVVLGPASALTGISLPTLERLRELRGTGENAGDWLYLWMVTAALFVVLPRLLLALGNWLQSIRMRRRLPVLEDFYARRVLRDASGQGRTVRVIPYGLELASQAEDRLKRLLVEALGDRTKVEVDRAVAYGGEDEWLAARGNQLATADQLILLFNMASTPESENHGAVATSVRERLGEMVEMTVLLDDSSLMRTLHGLGSAPRRVDERLQAWRLVLAPSRTDPIAVSLDGPANLEAGRALEQALLRGATA